MQGDRGSQRTRAVRSRCPPGQVALVTVTCGYRSRSSISACISAISFFCVAMMLSASSRTLGSVRFAGSLVRLAMEGTSAPPTDCVQEAARGRGARPSNSLMAAPNTSSASTGSKAPRRWPLAGCGNAVEQPPDEPASGTGTGVGAGAGWGSGDGTGEGGGEGAGEGEGAGAGAAVAWPANSRLPGLRPSLRHCKPACAEPARSGW